MEIPVYVFTGFLDSGKSTFLQSTLEDKRFNSGERTLILLCEEGEVELDPARFAGKNVTVEIIEDAAVFTPEYLLGLQKKCRAHRVMVEYNGMWLLSALYDNMPSNWIVYQEMMFADANSFPMFNTNMRNLTVDKMRGAQLIVFNRAQKGFNKMELHKIVRGVSRRTEIAYEYGEDDVEYDDIEDPLPFDKEANCIVINDMDFALWYRDLSEELSSYDGKSVNFKGQVVVDGSIPKGCFIVGRPLMTCCVDDIRFAGLICEWERASQLANRNWVSLTATIAVRRHPCYDRIGPVLTALTVETVQQPENEVATFY